MTSTARSRQRSRAGDHVDLLDVLNRQAGVPLTEANRIALALHEQHMSLGSFAERLEEGRRERGWSTTHNSFSGLASRSR